MQDGDLPRPAGRRAGVDEAPQIDDLPQIDDQPRIDDLTRRWAAREEMAWSGELVDPAFRLAVGALPGAVRHIAGYHFGWWDEHGRAAGPDASQTLRSTLVLLTARSVGGDPAAAVPAAVAVELAHHFSLLHDDVIDGRISRRRRPTAWNVFGLRAAILAGDALLATALEVLAASGHALAEDGMRVLSAAVLEVVDAQSAGIALGAGPAAQATERLRVAAGKTGALFGCACALGAALGGGDHWQVEHMRRFGQDLGRAFQAGDHLPRDLAPPDGGPSPATVNGGPGRTDRGNGTATPARPAPAGAAPPRADYLVARALGHLAAAGLTERGTDELAALATLAADGDHHHLNR